MRYYSNLRSTGGPATANSAQQQCWRFLLSSLLLLTWTSPSIDAFRSIAPTKSMKSSFVMAVHSSSRSNPETSTIAMESTTTAKKTMTKAGRKKKKKQKRGKGETMSSSISTIMSEQDVATHVGHAYLDSPGGILNRTRRKQQEQQPTTTTTTTTSLDLGTTMANPQPQSMLDAADSAKQRAHLHHLDRHPALVLNADYQPMSYLPLSMWHWQEAIKAVFAGKVSVVDVYPGVTVRAASLEIPLPAVIALTEYVRPPSGVHARPAFTRRNVFLRDSYRCQYCRKQFVTKDLSLDHVVPRCRGGSLNWENAVTCCKKCNCLKGSLSAEEAAKRLGLKLEQPPRVPTQRELAASARNMVHMAAKSSPSSSSSSSSTASSTSKMSSSSSSSTSSMHKPPRRRGLFHHHPTWEPYLGMLNHPPSKNGNGGQDNANLAMALEEE